MDIPLFLFGLLWAVMGVLIILVKHKIIKGRLARIISPSIIKSNPLKIGYKHRDTSLDVIGTTIMAVFIFLVGLFMMFGSLF